MRLTNFRWLGGMMSLAAAVLWANPLNAGVLYSEDFESYGVDSLLVPSLDNVNGSGFVTARAGANTTGTLPVTVDNIENKLQVRSAASLANADGMGGGTSLPEAGLTGSNANWSGSKFVEFHDGGVSYVNLTAHLSSPLPTTGSPYTFSFDFYEPAGYPATGGTQNGNGNGIAIVMGNAGDPLAVNTTGLGATANRFSNVIIGDGISGDPTPADSQILLVSSVTPIISNQSALDNLSLDTKHSMMMVGNFNTGMTQSYTDAHGNAHTVDSNRYDIFLDGALVASGVGYRSNAPDPNVTAITDIGFLFASNAAVGVMYFDNILVRNDFAAVSGPPAPGDFNADGHVDGSDFSLWQANFPTSAGATSSQGDGDGDGDVDGADFIAWQTHYSPSGGVSSTTTAVPEPTGITLLGAASLFGLSWQLGRKKS